MEKEEERKGADDVQSQHFVEERKTPELASHR